jgi:anti-sigma B factor antagonist
VERSSGAAPPRPSGGSDQNGFVPLTVHIEDSDGGASIVAIAGELDLSTIRRMEAPLLEQLDQRRAVLVDLSRLSFIDSTGIGVLIKAHRVSNGTPMHVIIGADSQPGRVFQIAGIERALRVYSDRDQALAALAEVGDNGRRNTGD